MDRHPGQCNVRRPKIWARVNVRREGALGLFWPKYFVLDWPTPLHPGFAVLDHVRAEGFEPFNIISWDEGYTT